MLNPAYYATGVLNAQGTKAPEYDASTKTLNMIPNFGWGTVIDGPSGVGSSPPNLTFPSYLNHNHTRDLTGSLSKIWGTAHH